MLHSGEAKWIGSRLSTFVIRSYFVYVNIIHKVKLKLELHQNQQNTTAMCSCYTKSNLLLQQTALKRGT